MTLVDSCIVDVPCGALLALLIPAAVICVLGLMEWLFDRELPEPWERRCQESPECLRERDHEGACYEDSYD